MRLAERKCVPCEGGTPPLTEEEARGFLAEVGDGWEVINGKVIRKSYTFRNFKEAVEFINTVADIAESEGHHPDIRLYNYKKLDIELSTHVIGGLSENDFIMAAKIGEIDR